MNISLSLQNGEAYLTDAPSEFHVVVLYEDGDSGRVGKRISDKLLPESGEWECSRQLWSFDVLAIGEVAEAASDAARWADLLIVSVSGERELPGHIKNWLERWASLIDTTRPLMAAMFRKTDNPTAYQTHRFLQILAGERGLSYFPHQDFQAYAESVFEGAEIHDSGITVTSSDVPVVGNGFRRAAV